MRELIVYQIRVIDAASLGCIFTDPWAARSGISRHSSPFIEHAAGSGAMQTYPCPKAIGSGSPAPAELVSNAGLHRK